MSAQDAFSDRRPDLAIDEVGQLLFKDVASLPIPKFSTFWSSHAIN
jgi:hypothetical protein